MISELRKPNKLGNEMLPHQQNWEIKLRMVLVSMHCDEWDMIYIIKVNVRNVKCRNIEMKKHIIRCLIQQNH